MQPLFFADAVTWHSVAASAAACSLGFICSMRAFAAIVTVGCEIVGSDELSSCSVDNFCNLVSWQAHCSVTHIQNVAVSLQIAVHHTLTALPQHKVLAYTEHTHYRFAMQSNAKHQQYKCMK